MLDLGYSIPTTGCFMEANFAQIANLNLVDCSIANLNLVDCSTVTNGHYVDCIDLTCLAVYCSLSIKLLVIIIHLACVHFCLAKDLICSCYKIYLF